MPNRLSRSRPGQRAVLAAFALGALGVAFALSGGRQPALGGVAPPAPYEPGVVVVGFRPAVSAAAADATLARTGLVRATERDDQFSTVLLRPT